MFIDDNGKKQNEYGLISISIHKRRTRVLGKVVRIGRRSRNVGKCDFVFECIP